MTDLHDLAPRQAGPARARAGNDVHNRRSLLALGLATALGAPHVAAGTSAPVGPGESAVGPNWFEAGRPTALASQVLARLARAADDGLEPADYGSAALKGAFDAATSGPPLAPAVQQRLQRALTLALRRLLADLHHGRGDGRALGAPIDPAHAASFDLDAALRRLAQAGRLDDLWTEATPPWPQYPLLRQALARYRAMDAAAWRQRLPAVPGRSLEPGQAWGGLAGLGARLQVLGDLASPWTSAPEYSGALVEAVKAFQGRHGLEADGRIGRGTLAALEVAPPARARQIASTMERLRWSPPPPARRWIEVDIPAYTLRAHVRRDDGTSAPALAMRVIVGQARETPTPLLHASVRAIEFSPHWNVPLSIARSELVPRLQREPAYFEHQGFELVGRDGRVATVLDPAALDAVLRGEQRLRQRPGARNALGDIKFVFPNTEAIFMHHTPSVGLFNRDRRDFSHGCIRVQEPVALAMFVLQGQGEWTEARIREAMGGDQPRTVRVTEALPVRLEYLTARVEGEAVHLWADVYGLDVALERALQHRSRQRRAALERSQGLPTDEP